MSALLVALGALNVAFGVAAYVGHERVSPVFAICLGINVALDGLRRGVPRA